MNYKSILQFVSVIFKHCFTEMDNETYDLGRIMWGMGGVVFFGLSIFAVVAQHQAFSPMDWGAGLGGVIAGGGAGIAIKSREK